ncbi:hypothetical protein [Candidatus Clostridium helianthi]|uniref:Uncharacterized protein n=1 Tax=Candidatus Clostridium helianthi TaxID=3381660 RepID=A0ABW8S2S3_9CLOT
MISRKITLEEERKLEKDISLFAQLSEKDKGFVMGTIWALLAKQKEPVKN